MDSITVITNNVPRDIIDACQLTDDERNEFTYLDWHKIENGEAGASFVRYKGQLYDLADTEALELNPAVYPSHRALEGWHGIVRDSFYSGVLFKFTDDNEQVICGRYY